jgi:molecular chaperone DnaK
MLGIDLGTSFSAVAAIDATGRAYTVPNRDGDVLTPSAVYVHLDTAVVGQAALDIQFEQPDRVATLIKRRMGYGSFGRPLDGREFRPETLAAILLRKLARDAAERLGPPGSVVITVPAYFDDTRRKATLDAGRIAGLNVLDVLDEPCAAALTYAFQSAEPPRTEQNILVYDLGGGTFDVSIVRVGPRRVRTIAIAGDVELGGHDWDARLVDWAADAFRADFGTDPRDDPKSRAALFHAAERAKRTLTKLPATTLTVGHAGHSMSLNVSRAEFEKMTRDLLLRTRLTVQELLRQSNLAWSDIERTILVGGSTHMPMTRALIEELSGKPPETALAVSEVVARGAAIHAQILSNRSYPREAGTAEVVEIRVNAHGLGVEVRDGEAVVNDVVIPRNTQLPAAATRTYHTRRAGQSKVRVKILQGDARQASACLPVGEVWIEELPEGLPAGSPVEVSCRYAENGLIEVTARETVSGQVVRATLHRSAGLADCDIERERDWLAALSIL